MEILNQFQSLLDLVPEHVSEGGPTAALCLPCVVHQHIVPCLETWRQLRRLPALFWSHRNRRFSTK